MSTDASVGDFARTMCGSPRVSSERRLDQRVCSREEADTVILDATKANVSAAQVLGTVVSLMNLTNAETVIVAGKVRE